MHTSAGIMLVYVFPSTCMLLLCVHRSTGIMLLCVHPSTGIMLLRVHPSAGIMLLCVHPSSTGIMLLCVHPSTGVMLLCVQPSNRRKFACNFNYWYLLVNVALILQFYASLYLHSIVVRYSLPWRITTYVSPDHAIGLKKTGELAVYETWFRSNTLHYVMRW
jgi:hypothetical protein